MALLGEVLGERQRNEDRKLLLRPILQEKSPRLIVAQHLGVPEDDGIRDRVKLVHAICIPPSALLLRCPML